MEAHLKKEEESLLSPQRKAITEKNKRQRGRHRCNALHIQQRYAKREKTSSEKLDQYQILRSHVKPRKSFRMEKKLYNDKTDTIENQQN